MKVDPKIAVVLIAGFALYQVLGPYLEHLRGLVDCLVITELAFRAIKPGESTNSDFALRR
jgi:hypothetical protein